MARFMGSMIGTALFVFVLQILAGYASGQITTFDDFGQFWSEYTDYQSQMIDSLQGSFDEVGSGHPEMDPAFDDYSE